MTNPTAADLPIKEPVSGIIPHNPAEVAASTIPQFEDERKTAFLSFRASGFSTRESYQLAQVDRMITDEWRKSDPAFVEEEKKLYTQYGSINALRYVEIEFLRNFRLMLIKDSQVITANLNGEEQSALDWQYLLKARQHYTPAALQALHGILSNQPQPGVTNFTQYILNMQNGQFSVGKQQSSIAASADSATVDSGVVDSGKLL